ncbi:MAG TPA: hypothetical protein DCR93_03770, partial [Cytophagales bacterium]|nr:hypothetical protein [Cytophagales bacterium]
MAAQGQSVTLVYEEEPLNEILLDLSLRYSMQVSIDAQVSAGCVLTLQSEYPTIDSALHGLAEACGLEVVQIAGVYTFRYQLPPSTVVAGPPGEERYLYQGQVVARATGEPL